MAQSLHIGLQGPFTNLPFGICAIYFDLKVIELNESLHLLLYCVTTETRNGILGNQCASPKPGTFKNFQKMDL